MVTTPDTGNHIQLLGSANTTGANDSATVFTVKVKVNEGGSLALEAINGSELTVSSNKATGKFAVRPAAENAIEGIHYKGDWTNGTDYVFGDIVKTDATHYYVCVTGHTASGSIDTTKFVAAGDSAPANHDADKIVVSVQS